MDTEKCLLDVWALGVAADFLEKIPEDCCGQEMGGWSGVMELVTNTDNSLEKFDCEGEGTVTGG